MKQLDAEIDILTARSLAGSQTPHSAIRSPFLQSTDDEPTSDSHISRPAATQAGMVERLDEHILHLLTRLFPEPTLHGIEFLAHLCRRATEKQYSLFPGQTATAVAVISCHGVPDLLAQPGWKWSRETTLIMLQALEALTVLTRLRRARRTEIHIPLGRRPLNPSLLLARLTHATYTNRKTRRFLARIATRLCHLLPAFSEHSTENESFPTNGNSTPSLPACWYDGVLSLLAEEGISRPRRQRIAFRLALAWPAGPPAPDTVSGYATCSLGQEPGPVSETLTQLTTDTPHLEGWERSTSAEISSHEAGEHHIDTEPSVLNKEPDSPEAPSPPEAVWEDEGSDMPEAAYPDPETEARAIWTLLTTRAQRHLPGSARQIQQIKQWLHEHPMLVRTAMINTLMQRVFPDHHGSPGIGWFVKSYRLYVEEKLPITPEIASWVWTSYTYEQIDAALLAERERQEQCFQIPYRPDASCLQEGQWQEADPLRVSMPQAEEDDAVGDASQETDVAPPCHEAAWCNQQRGEGLAEEPIQQTVTVAETEEGLGWFEAQWWHRRLQATPLAEACAIEIHPTETGRFGLLMTPHDDPDAAWIWTRGRQVRAYITTVSAHGEPQGDEAVMNRHERGIAGWNH